MLDHFGQHPLQSRPFQAHGSLLHRKCLRTKGFDLKSIALQFLRDARKNYHLPRLQLHQKGHQQPLSLHPLHLAIMQNLLEKHPFVRHMLIEPRWFRLVLACSASTKAAFAVASWM